MNGTASDLKSAHVQFTRAGMIVEELIPAHREFSSSGEIYWSLIEVVSQG